MRTPKLRPGFWATQKGTCRWCVKAIVEGGVVNRKKNWHADCYHEYCIVTDPAYAKRMVFERDQGVCAVCGVDTKEIKKKMDLLRSSAERPKRDDETGDQFTTFIFQAQVDLLKYEMELAIDRVKNPNRHLWEADHKQALCKSNGEIKFFILDNIQTLCVPCHVIKSKQDTADCKLNKIK